MCWFSEFISLVDQCINYSAYEDTDASSSVQPIQVGALTRKIDHDDCMSWCCQFNVVNRIWKLSLWRCKHNTDDWRQYWKVHVAAGLHLHQDWLVTWTRTTDLDENLWTLSQYHWRRSGVTRVRVMRLPAWVPVPVSLEVTGTMPVPLCGHARDGDWHGASLSSLGQW